MRISQLPLIVVLILAAFLVLLSTRSPVRADEGMWLLNQPPAAQLKKQYGFDPAPAWLEHLQKSCVHMGASASLISADGLVLTNHHVGVDQLFKLSTPGHDFVRDGFYARTQAEEVKCPDQEVQILWSIEDVTDRVNAAAPKGMPSAEAYQKRRAEMSRIEKASKDQTGLDSEVVTLWHGARYHLYRYRKYTDVRLVMAPEKSIAFFGGDTDNFEYPRYDLDFCLFRIYEDGKAIRPEHYLKWSRRGASDNELLFVGGHPGRTRRLLTVDHLKFLRDVSMPETLSFLYRRESQLQSFCNRSDEYHRIGEEDLFSIQNGRKARVGGYETLLDPALFQHKLEAETSLKESAKNTEPWDRIAQAEKTYRSFYTRYDVLKEGRTLNSKLFGIARTVVRLVDELPKPSPDRLREYRDSELDSVYFGLYSPAPIYDALEIDGVSSALAQMAERLGGDDPLVAGILDGLPPRARAERLVRGCILKDVETRKKLVTGGKAAVSAASDPMIRLAIALDPESRALRKRFEDEVEGVERENYARIAAAKFERYGESMYPDATGTLRFAFGPVKGYEEDGRQVPPFTTIAGLYQRNNERGPGAPFDLPPKWIAARSRVDLRTPFNFVLTADIIGGNSGSPVVNKAGEIVGLIFDGNLQSLALDIAYDERQARAVAVDTRAILEALKSVYGAERLVKEITGE